MHSNQRWLVEPSIEGTARSARAHVNVHKGQTSDGSPNDLAWILQEHYHRYAAALELANIGLRLEPDNLYVLDTRGTILSNLPDRLADARNDFERLVELSTSDTREQAKALLQLGRICAKLNDLVQAKQHLKNALEIDRKIDVFTPDERSEIKRIVQRSGTQAVNSK